jgi:hypothetical protein
MYTGPAEVVHGSIYLAFRLRRLVLCTGSLNGREYWRAPGIEPFLGRADVLGSEFGELAELRKAGNACGDRANSR